MSRGQDFFDETCRDFFDEYAFPPFMLVFGLPLLVIGLVGSVALDIEEMLETRRARQMSSPPPPVNSDPPHQ